MHRARPPAAADGAAGGAGREPHPPFHRFCAMEMCSDTNVCTSPSRGSTSCALATPGSVSGCRFVKVASHAHATAVSAVAFYFCTSFVLVFIDEQGLQTFSSVVVCWPSRAAADKQHTTPFGTHLPVASRWLATHRETRTRFWSLLLKKCR
jgi:hypothetical protein